MTKNKSETKIAIGTEDGYIALFEMNSDGLDFEKSFTKQYCMHKMLFQATRFSLLIRFFYMFSENINHCLAQRSNSYWWYWI